MAGGFEAYLAKKAKRREKAAALGITIAELTKRNKAAASRQRREAERRYDLLRDADVLFAEVVWRGLVLAPEDRAALEKATSRKGIREMSNEDARALLDRVGKAISVAAHATARRLRDVALPAATRSRWRRCRNGSATSRRVWHFWNAPAGRPARSVRSVG